jgi:thioredoxin-dependent peroxiredoxin
MKTFSRTALCAGILAMGILSSLANNANAEPLKVGDAAPDAASVDQNGKSVTLSALYGSGWTLVYFYPKADTPGCTAEACSLRDAFADLTKKGVTVVGVSTDKPKEQRDFQEKYHLPFTLLADSGKNVVKAFGVPTTMGFASRQSFLIKSGKIVWRDLHASTKEQAADILKAIGAAKD